MATVPRGLGSKGLGKRRGARSRRGGLVAGGMVFLAASAIVVAATVALIERRPAAEVTGTVNANACPADLANSRKLDDCVSACIACSHGTVVTCTTACRLKGAN